MDNDKTKVIMGLIVASLREGLGMSRYALAQEAGVDYSWLRRFEQGKSGSGGNPYWACKGIGVSGNIVGAMEKALENPDTWLEEHEWKRI